ncbi:MAG: GNAT family N-acetyltransferase [Candidatus Bathyarchaeia archaeon]
MSKRLIEVGPIYIRTMRKSDYPHAVELTSLMRWGNTERDFEWMSFFEPHGCFVAVDGSRLVGVATTIGYGGLGWIGNVIVSPEYRGMGVGSLLVDHAIEYFKARSTGSVGLYSYPENLRFYKRIGFVEDSSFVWLTCPQVRRGFPRADNPRFRRMERRDLKSVIDLDKDFFGADRSRVLTKIYSEFDELCWVSAYGKEVQGYIMGTRSGYRIDIGPWAHGAEDGLNAITLLNTFLRRLAGTEANIGVQAGNLKARLIESGFIVKSHVIRMFLNGKKPPTRDDCLLAIESLERG